MDIFLIDFFCGLFVYYCIKKFLGLFEPKELNYDSDVNKYIEIHNIRLEQRKEYQDYLDYCNKTNQPIVLKEDEYYDEIELSKEYTFNENTFFHKDIMHKN